MTETRVARVRRIATGLATLVFPALWLAGVVLHLDSLHFGGASAPSVVGASHDTTATIGHLLVIAAVPLLVASIAHLGAVSHGRGAVWTTIGGALAAIGGVALAVREGALALSLAALGPQAAPDAAATVPALQPLLDWAGWLWLGAFVALLPVGLALQAGGLYLDGLAPGWQAATIAGGALFLLPGLGPLAVGGAALLTVGFAGLGARVLRTGLHARPPRAVARLLSRPLVVRVPVAARRAPVDRSVVR